MFSAGGFLVSLPPLFFVWFTMWVALFCVMWEKSCIFAVVKIEEAIVRFVDYIAVERRMAAGTVRNYEGDLRDLQAFLLPLEVTELDDLSARDIR